ncbi:MULTISPECIES: hypothetical protein [Mesorhizobium]|uniref:hypothetical protein n=1 Tax=Rhizobium loti TaxID=381 RepID=UPI001596DD4A
MLKIDGILSVTIFETVQDEFGEDAVPDGVRRTLERRIVRWRALSGGEKEIIFAQRHATGRQGLSDFTICDDLRITMGGECFGHRLFHFRLACSGWEHAAVVQQGSAPPSKQNRAATPVREGLARFASGARAIRRSLRSVIPALFGNQYRSMKRMSLLLKSAICSSESHLIPPSKSCRVVRSGTDPCAGGWV